MEATHANTAHPGSQRMPGITSGNTPVLSLDAREHACCLQHPNRLPKQVGALYEVVNWAEVAHRFAQTR